MSSTPPSNAKAVPHEGYETLPSVGKEESEFAKYGLSPPPKAKKGWRTFAESEKTIKREFKKKWESSNDDDKKILLFLYSRGFHRYKDQPTRIYHTKQMLQTGEVRERMLQVINTGGDTDMSSFGKWQLHYIDTCLTLHRYFRQAGANGFVTDMSSLVYYLREQMHGTTCFLQAACVTMCYILQSHDTLVPPVDASRLIRNQYFDDQLFQYFVKDKGGDSVAILRILDYLFFDCDFRSRPYEIIGSTRLAVIECMECAKSLIGLRF
jgi:hypothetical protein